MRDIIGILRAPARYAGSCLAVAAWLALAPAAQAGVPYPTAKTPAAVDLGVFDAQQAPLSVSVMLKLRNVDELESLAAAQQTPGHPLYRQFLTPAQFQQRFGASADTVAAATAYFRSAGLTVAAKGNTLTVSGPAKAVQTAFGVRLHQFEVAAQGKSAAYRFHAPTGSTAIAAPAVAQSVAGVFGLDSRPLFRPLSQQAPAALRGLSRQPAAGVSTTPDSPGHWTVTDLAQYYNVQPLYAQGINGAGRTLGIVTLAAFTPSDAFQYWASLGLSVDPARLTVVDVDGGPGAPSDSAGSDETTLDVEQSGGLAPGAKMIVYQAPNTDQGFVDAFVQAINDNTADSFSVSWGLWEFWDTQDSVTTGSGRAKTALAAYTNLFLQATVQGQSGFASSGDSGGYEPNNPSSGTGVPGFTQTLGVDAPAAAAWITAAGGTTLPGTQKYGLPGGGTFPVVIASEQAWGWDYLTGLCTALGYDPVSCGIFPGGSGGGVSSYIKAPFYQTGLSGLRVTEADQVFTDLTVDPPLTYVTLPAGFAGRNLPDVSLNADPETGYTVLYTSDTSGQSTLTYFGGTSFVAPQLNGIAALMNQRAGGRVGLWNFQLYRLARMPRSYLGASAPLRDITAGDNWFYSGVKGYDAATGVGTLNVTNFVNAVAGTGQ